MFEMKLFMTKATTRNTIFAQWTIPFNIFHLNNQVQSILIGSVLINQKVALLSFAICKIYVILPPLPANQNNHSMNKRNITLISTMLFIAATLWQQTIHESGHFIAALLLHSQYVTLYHNYVAHDMSSLDMTSRIVIAAAGPLISLLVGIVFQFICSQFEKRNSLFLFLLYMSAFGYINFGGYLLISPIFTGGDTGFIFQQLGFPIWLSILFALGGVVFLFYCMKMLSHFFVEMASVDILNDDEKRKQFIDALIQYPIYFGIAATVLLNLPAPVFLSLLYPICSPFTLFWGYGYLTNGEYSVAKANKTFDQWTKIQPGVVVFLILSILVNRLLVFGLHF